MPAFTFRALPCPRPTSPRPRAVAGPAALLVLLALLVAPSRAKAADYVIAISVDGMASAYVQPMLNDGLLPNLEKLRKEGACTFNARTDADYAITLPNHTCMLTGRPVTGPDGHHWTRNRDPEPGETLASNRPGYIASMFDVAHDHGRSTALWSGKSKFSLYDTSWNAEHGQPDTTDLDHGSDKIDYAMVIDNTMAPALTANFIVRMTREPAQLAFVHFRDPDTHGHAEGWDTHAYRNALIAVDQSIGVILALIEQDDRLRGKTALIVTSDHGGHDKGHGDMDDIRDFMIPFFLWGPGIAHGDLYALNPNSRKDPANANVPYAAPKQPIRNGDLGNLALDLLGLPPIPGSTINPHQDLKAQQAN